jgi:2-haloacid dehalogenase
VLKSDTDLAPVVVWDLGNVLIPWDRHGALLAAVGDDSRARRLAEEVFTLEVNGMLDAGRAPAEIRSAVESSHEGLGWVVDAYIEHFRHSLGPVMAGSAALLEEVAAAHRCVGLSNWSSITFEGIPDDYPVLGELEGVVISGDVGVVKPEAAIFAHCENRFDFESTQAVFIDDSAANIDGAMRCGWDAIHFRDPEQLRSDLSGRGLI